jgi:formiminoglutamase
LPPLDAGNVRIERSLEWSQEALAEVVGGILTTGAVPVVLGGGHETAFGSYLGYAKAGKPVGIINIDAHLDVRPCLDGRGNSGTPFRQAMENPSPSLPGTRYVCLGAQGHVTAREHLEYARQRGCVVVWRENCDGQLKEHLTRELRRLEKEGCQVHLTIDADAVDARSVPGVSAPNVDGLEAREVLACARIAGESSAVTSLEIVEINPSLDRDGVSARWGALVVWEFLMGITRRRSKAASG